MKSKLIILLILISGWCFGQSVPNNEIFSLQDVYNVVHSHASGTTFDQNSCFANAISGYFDATYNNDGYAPANSMLRFRNYTVGLCTQPSLLSFSYVVGSQTSSTITASAEVYTDGTCTVTERGIVAALTSNPTTSDFKATDGSGVGHFTATVTGLASNTPYYVRAYYISSQGTVYTSTELYIVTDP